MQLENKTIPAPLVKINQGFIIVCIVISWIVGNELILLFPIIAGLLSLLFGFNPIIQLSKHLLTKNLSSYRKEDWDQQQFNQGISVSCLTIGLLSFMLNWNIAGYIFTMIVFLAALIAILGFCIGCFVRFQWKMYRSRRVVQ